MQSARIHEVRHAQLFDSPQTLYERVFHQVENKRIRDCYKTINRVVDDFLFVISLDSCSQLNTFMVWGRQVAFSPIQS